MSKEVDKIKELWFSDDLEDKDIAYKWLCQMIGVKDANANLFILSFYKDWEDDKGVKVYHGNYWDLKFNTYPTSFGKDYRYTVKMVAWFNNVELINIERDYSRWQVGNGEPKWDLCQTLCDAFRKSGYVFHDELFHSNQKENV